MMLLKNFLSKPKTSNMPIHRRFIICTLQFILYNHLMLRMKRLKINSGSCHQYYARKFRNLAKTMQPSHTPSSRSRLAHHPRYSINRDDAYPQTVKESAVGGSTYHEGPWWAGHTWAAVNERYVNLETRAKRKLLNGIKILWGKW